jgi:hypothetical protein
MGFNYQFWEVDLSGRLIDGEIMALLASTLATELKNMTLYDLEADAILAWAAAYKTYFEGATSNGVTIVPTSLVPAESAMVGASTGLSADAATALQTGITAFWTAIIPAVAWPTVTAITPSTLLPGLGAALTGVFASNTSGSLSKDDSMDAIAGVIHTNSLTGIAVWPTPGPGPQPIL